MIFKFICKDKETKIAQIILKGKNKIVGVILSNFKSSYKAAVFKRVCYQWKDRHVDMQTNGGCRIQKEAYRNIASWFLIKVQKYFNGERIVGFFNDVVTIGHYMQTNKQTKNL